MKKEIIQTKDGSTTFYLPELNETYHSKNGAIQEAYHVFIKNGFSLFERKPISILEIGFGTGLNAFITSLESQKNNQIIDYVGVEAYPVSMDEAFTMNYVNQIDASKKEEFKKIHQMDWETPIQVNPTFHLTKRKQFFQDIADVEVFDLIYFDAFGYDVQPELWSDEIFLKMFNALKSGGILVTYACRTVIKNSMIAAGFKIEKLPGAPGKREMLRASKQD
ncbi:tRNA (5-methylaminomethyl-2-thiouridine)(34)-methyltransferase MnmD [Flavobacterium dankookense]|uniref:tRNA U34 5-methylaminomethyl-2-thiouridine-forming methyltransferase MnmC n=1 Tax=Flavobacterium dankookense TaxID=706186 RepID=A0A4R6QDY2_9FLAO|nr:tRNA (5-methylaminomethyl-2-thiouridine)(34)-methyltransferase MnmD [Flavobacterium dankookense]TDP60898.1 tRNA U34 5-methylaminomethyl-2-thiouridine-forming methyltransferase MnmC [Flavobacterium dankookense]